MAPLARLATFSRACISTSRICNSSFKADASSCAETGFLYNRAGCGSLLPNSDVCGRSYVRMHKRSNRSSVNLLNRSPLEGEAEGDATVLPWRLAGMTSPPLDTRRSWGAGEGPVMPPSEGWSCVCMRVIVRVL